jgi:hypothetical protein
LYPHSLTPPVPIHACGSNFTTEAVLVKGIKLSPAPLLMSRVSVNRLVPLCYYRVSNQNRQLHCNNYHVPPESSWVRRHKVNSLQYRGCL